MINKHLLEWLNRIIETYWKGCKHCWFSFSAISRVSPTKWFQLILYLLEPLQTWDPPPPLLGKQSIPFMKVFHCSKLPSYVESQSVSFLFHSCSSFQSDTVFPDNVSKSRRWSHSSLWSPNSLKQSIMAKGVWPIKPGSSSSPIEQLIFRMLFRPTTFKDGMILTE